MKKSFILLVLASMMTLGLSAQNIIAAWTFDSLKAAPNTLGVISANTDIGELFKNAAIYLDGTNGSSKFESSEKTPQLTAFAGDTLGDPRDTKYKGMALSLANQTANGYNVVVKFSTVNFADVVMTFVTRGTKTGFATHAWAYSLDGKTFTDLKVENTAVTSSTFLLKTIDLSDIEAVNNQEAVYVRLTISGATNETGNNRLDNFVVSGTFTAQDVVAPSVKSYKVNSFTDMTLTFSEPLDSASAKVENFTILDSTIKVTKATLTKNNVIALTFDALKESVEYQMVVANITDTAKNVMDNDTLAISFGVEEKYIVSTIAELKSKFDYSNNAVNQKDTIEYKYVGKAIVTAKIPYNNQKFIQDSTGAILIYDAAGTIKTAVEIGDEVTNIYGKMTNYFGFVELVPTANFEFTGSSFNEVEPLEITLAQLMNLEYMKQHQSELIKVKNVSFKDAGSKFVGPTSSNKGNKYDITQDTITDNSVFINIDNSDLNGSEIPAGNVDIVGLAFQDNYKVDNVKINRYYILPRSLADITKVTGIVNNEIKTIAVYPNPTTNFVAVEVEAQNVVAQVFDIYGKLLATESIEAGYDRIDLSSFSNGLYIIRLSSENKVIATAKVIKR